MNNHRSGMPPVLLFAVIKWRSLHLVVECSCPRSTNPRRIATASKNGPWSKAIHTAAPDPLPTLTRVPGCYGGSISLVTITGASYLSATEGETEGMAEAKRRLAAILAADVAGYSRLMGDDEQATLNTLNAYRAVFR